MSHPELLYANDLFMFTNIGIYLQFFLHILSFFNFLIHSAVVLILHLHKFLENETAIKLVFIKLLSWIKKELIFFQT